MALRNLLFDLDGTLTDPKEGITNCIRHAMDQMGAPVSAETDLDWCIGPPLHNSFAELLEGDAVGATRALELYRERFSEVGLLENAVYPGIPELLTVLKAEGYRMVVATSKPGIYAERIIGHFELADYFGHVYGSELDGRLADKRDLLRALLRSESISPSESVMIGDRRHDVEGAKANDIPAISVAWGYGSFEELSAALPDAICQRIDEMPAVLKALDNS